MALAPKIPLVLVKMERGIGLSVRSRAFWEAAAVDKKHIIDQAGHGADTGRIESWSVVDGQFVKFRGIRIPDGQMIIADQHGHLPMLVFIQEQVEHD